MQLSQVPAATPAAGRGRRLAGWSRL